MTVTEYENIVKLCGLSIRISERYMTAYYGNISICSYYCPGNCLIILSESKDYGDVKYKLEFVTEPVQAQKLIINQIRKIKESLTDIKKQTIERDFS